MDDRIDLNIFDVESIRAAREAGRTGSRRARRHLDALATVFEFACGTLRLLESSGDYKAIPSASSPTIVAYTSRACCLLNNDRHDGDNDSLLVHYIGALGILPREIFEGILVDRLDLTSLTRLRRVSREFCHAIDTLPHCQSFITYAPALCALHSVSN
jgi:hypothetical protein